MAQGLTIITITLIGVLLSFSHLGKLHKIISIGIFVSVFIQFWSNEVWHYVFILGLQTIIAIASIFYAFRNTKLSALEKTCIITLPLILVIGSHFELYHWPGAIFPRFALFIPIILFFLINLSINTYSKKYFGFMISWFVLAIFHISRHFL